MGENLFVSGSGRDPRDRGGQHDPRYYPPRPPAHDADEHPGMANYPSDGVNHRRQRRSSTPSANRYLPDLEARSPNRGEPPPGVGGAAGRSGHSGPRSAAQRSRDMGSKMYGLFHRAATADGADKSGLTALTYPVMANFAVDSAMAVALANTLFFAAASGESKSKVALYLLITIAPFAVIAPLIGPALDRLQHGRRLALAMSFTLRSALVVVLIANYDGATGSFPSWVLYPCALGMMVLSKSFSVLRSAVTPRVLPPTIDLVRVNSRLTVFGLLGGTIAGGAVAAGAEYLFNLFHMPGALYVCIAMTVAGAVLAMRIPKWVEVTTGEVPTTLSYHGGADEPAPLVRGAKLRRHPQRRSETRDARQPLGRNIITALWGNCTIKVMVGFLFLYPAFVAKSHEKSGWEQLMILGLIGAAAAIGNFGGNYASARLQLGHPAQLVVRSTTAVTLAALVTALTGKLLVAALAALVTSAASAIAKASLDASLQDDLPEESRASAFGRSESLLQLAWVAGGATGVLVYTQLHIGFTVISTMLILGLAQTLVSYRGDSLIPGLGGNRPVVAAQEGGWTDPAGVPRE
ncbi:MFS transporter [Mycolicibacterium stellerae]|uniref:MFS transporter n=1 Tax=Mycolicibacterium stellerae TaxID=2358193 RepID=UPI000F0BBE13|nr:MFS transporter [Mycolicibacterium stellerae]